MVASQGAYRINEPSPYNSHNQDTYQTRYVDQPTNADISYSTNHDAQLDNSDGINSDMNHNMAHNRVIEQKTPTIPSLVWRLLPWVVMLLIGIGFVWWWQDIHHQLVQVLKTIE